jgi:hypothetical protein
MVQRLGVIPYFRSTIRTLSTGIARTVRPRLVTDVVSNLE